MKNSVDSLLRILLFAAGLVELYMASRMAMPGALIPLAIGIGILVWQGTSLQKLLRSRKSGGS